MEPPETRYALSGDVSIAYQVHGAGPLDLVIFPAWISNVELDLGGRDRRGVLPPAR